jgi:hypothetical protein
MIRWKAFPTWELEIKLRMDILEVKERCKRYYGVSVCIIRDDKQYLDFAHNINEYLDLLERDL